MSKASSGLCDYAALTQKMEQHIEEWDIRGRCRGAMLAYMKKRRDVVFWQDQICDRYSKAVRK